MNTSMALCCNTLLAVCRGCAQTEWRSTAVAIVHSQVFVTWRNSLCFSSVSSKFVSSDVILVDAGCEKHFPDLRNHTWRSRNVENGASQVVHISRQHRFVYQAGLPFPFSLGTNDLGHRSDEVEIRITLLQVVETL